MTDCKNCKYTDEYCASGECNKMQANNLACNKISLTEQWKKGVLPEGFYYVNDGAEVTIDYYLCDYWERHFGWDVQQIIAPVPSYEEWQASEKYNKHLEEVIKIYERKDKQATEKSITYNELLNENAQLKELLKECRNSLEEQSNVRKLYESDVEYRDRYNKKMDLLIKLDEVLK